MTTLNTIIDTLSATQQGFILVCVQEYGQRPDLHRGLLPFLPLEEAANCLRYRLELLKGAATEANPTPPGERFLRQLLSRLEQNLPRVPIDRTASVTMQLSDIALVKRFKKRVEKRFYIGSLGTDGTISSPSDQLIEMNWVGPNKWKVTTSKNALDSATTWLADKCR